MPKINNPAYGVVAATDFFGDLARPHADQVKGADAVNLFVVKHSGTFIAPLLLGSGPAAVAGFVVAIYVNSIKRVFWGALPHVGVKVFKTTPAFTNTNPSTSVVMEVARGRVRTPLEHSTPRVVRRRFIQAMFRLEPLRLLFSKASARSNQTGLQAIDRRNLFCSAIAAVTPKRNAPLFFASGGYGNNAAKSLIGDVTDHA